MDSHSVEVRQLQQGDIAIVSGRTIYVHQSGMTRGYTSCKIIGCYHRDLDNLEVNKKVWTLTYKHPQDIVKVISHESPQVAQRFNKVWDEIQTAQAQRSSENFNKIEYVRSEAGNGYRVKAQDGKTYKAGDVVDIQFSNGNAQALLGGSEGEMQNAHGDVAIRELKYLEQKAKLRYISPKYILGAPSRVMYTPEEIQRKLAEFNANRDSTRLRTAQKKAYHQSLR